LKNKNLNQVRVSYKNPEIDAADSLDIDDEAPKLPQLTTRQSSDNLSELLQDTKFVRKMEEYTTVSSTDHPPHATRSRSRSEPDIFSLRPVTSGENIPRRDPDDGRDEKIQTTSRKLPEAVNNAKNNLDKEKREKTDRGEETNQLQSSQKMSQSSAMVMTNTRPLPEVTQKKRKKILQTIQ